MRDEHGASAFVETLDAYAAAFHMDRLRQFLQAVRDESDAARS